MALIYMAAGKIHEERLIFLHKIHEGKKNRSECR